MKVDTSYNAKYLNSSKDTFFFKTITGTINYFSMIKNGDMVLVAVSGGSDSISLVLSLLALKDKYGIKIGIAHLNHMLRGEESLRDEVFVEKFAKELALPFFCRQVDVKGHAKKHGLSIEEAGRELRYDFFQHLADQHGYTKIATGHNKEDNAELVLINLLRGTGPKGLSGIPPIRDDIYIRPMIRISKKEILDLWDKVRIKGHTIVPLQVYISNGKAKIEIAVAKGKKLHDKRNDLAERDAKREQQRDLRQLGL